MTGATALKFPVALGSLELAKSVLFYKSILAPALTPEVDRTNLETFNLLLLLVSQSLGIILITLNSIQPN